jgi:hypothetical protein
MQYRICEITDKAEWEKVFNIVGEYSLYDSWGWGEYKCSKAWSVKRIRVVNESNEFLGQAQVQIKTRLVGLFKVVLMQGVCFRDDLNSKIKRDIYRVITNYKAPGYFGVFVYEDKKISSPELGLLAQQRKYTPLLPLGAYTAAIDLLKTEEELREMMTSNWRHNLKRGYKKGVEVRFAESAEDRGHVLREFVDQYQWLVRRKGFRDSLNLEAMIKEVESDARYLIAYASIDGETIATRIIFLGSNTALDYLTASTERAKNTYANYVLVWEVIRELKRRKIQLFDFGGIDPVNNEGTYNFKSGLNGQFVIQGIKWFQAKPQLIKPLAIRLLA